MNNKYVFVADSDGNRKATYLLNIGENEAEALARVQKEYPDCTCFIGCDEPDYREFVAENKLYIDGHYVERPPYVAPLEEVKAAKINELKGIRNAKELEPIEYKEHLFDADKDSLDRINYAIITLQATHTESIEWTCADNHDVEMTANDLQLLMACVGNRSNLLHIKYRELKEEVNACTTNEEVEAITWED